MADVPNLPRFMRGTDSFCSAISTSRASSHEENLLYFLAVVQHLKLDILPLTWQPGLDELGYGLSGIVNQSMMTAQLGLAFKRIDACDMYHTLASEIMVACSSSIRAHPNVNEPDGICWELKENEVDTLAAAIPVLVYPKAPFGNLRQFMKTPSGIGLSFSTKLVICQDIATAVKALHDSHAIHGDLKPENILVFQEGARFVVKISDFGSSSSWKDRNAMVKLPASRPWHAPEWHHRPIPINDAVKMDIYSFGLLSLWFFFQGDCALSLTGEVPMHIAVAFEHWKPQEIELFKENNSILDNVIPNIEISNSAEPQILARLQETFQKTLQHDPLERASSIMDIARSLKLDLAVNLDGLKLESVPPSPEISHADLNFAEPQFLVQYANSEYEVRITIIQALQEAANMTEQQSNSCHICSELAAAALALNHQIGFAASVDQRALESILEKSNCTLEAVQRTFDKVKEISYGDQDYYSSENFRSLSQAGHIHLKDPSCQQLFNSKRTHKLETGMKEELERVSKSLGASHIVTLTLQRSFALHLKECGHYVASFSHFFQLYETYRKILGDTHGDTLVIMDDLASVLERLGKFDQAATLTERALDVTTKRYGEGHATTQMIVGRLANLRCLQGRFSDASELHSSIVQSREQSLGKNHPYVISVILNMAFTLRDRGQLQKAAEHESDALKRSVESLGENHLLTLKSKGNLASTRFYQGNYSKAQELQEAVFVDMKKLLGEDHPDALLAGAELAMTYQRQGHTTDAAILLTLMLSKAEKTLLHLNPRILRMKSTLATLFLDQGDVKAALGLETEIYEDFQAALSPHHPDTLLALGNLASTHTEWGDLATAERLQNEALALTRAAYGEDHRETLSCKINIAALYSQQPNRLHDALVLSEEVCKSAPTLLGAKHPDTLTAQANLATYLHDSGESARAIDIMRQVQQTRESLPGFSPDHPAVLTDLANVAAIYESLGQLSEAEKIQIEVLQRRERLGDEASAGGSGSTHPLTFVAMHNLASTYMAQQKWDEAEALMVKELDVLRRDRALRGEGAEDGGEGEKILSAMSNLASLYWMKGERVRGLESMREVYEGRKRVLGPGNIATAKSEFMLQRMGEMLRETSIEGVESGENSKGKVNENRGKERDNEKT